MIYTLIIMVAGLIVIEAFAGSFAKLFGLSGATEGLCIDAMHIVSISFVFAGTNVAFQGIFQAINGGLESLIISICRQCLFILPLAYVFTMLAVASPDLTWLIWSAFPITELVTVLIAVLLMKRLSRTKINIMEA